MSIIPNESFISLKSDIFNESRIDYILKDKLYKEWIGCWINKIKLDDQNKQLRIIYNNLKKSHDNLKEENEELTEENEELKEENKELKYLKNKNYIRTIYVCTIL